jgi:hypothetical protein
VILIMPLDDIIFVYRQSPDWGRLAQDYEAGIAVDPSRYEPRSKPPGFPEDIVACIKAWNDTFPVNFFRCRQVLKEISGHSLRQINKATILSDDRLDELPAMIMGRQCLVFFFDDDDLFAPDTFERLSALDLGQCDVAVFPLVRFGMDIYTFARRGEATRVVVGTRRDFGHRFQTNNYGISSRIALSGHMPHLKDHVLGSVYADQQNIRDTYFDVVISATNKTPCSANTIGGLPSNQPEYRAFIRRYVENLRRLQIPRELGWMTEPVNATIKLFSDI